MDDPRKKSMRLKDFDYQSADTYFVTICLRTRSDLLGTVNNRGLLTQTHPGNIIAIALMSIPDHFDTVTLRDFVVMPDHVHALVGLDGGGRDSYGPALGEVVGRFKGITTHKYGKGVGEFGWPRYRGSLWQQGYYDHIIRNERDFLNRMTYIERNPVRWLEKRRGESF